jgi:hypothetical protein
MQDGDTQKELKSEAKPGFKAAFLVALALSSIYLAFIFIQDPSGEIRNPHYGHGDDHGHDVSYDDTHGNDDHGDHEKHTDKEDDHEEAPHH